MSGAVGAGGSRAACCPAGFRVWARSEPHVRAPPLVQEVLPFGGVVADHELLASRPYWTLRAGVMIALEGQNAETNVASDSAHEVRGRAVPGTGGEDGLAVRILGAFGTATGAWILQLASLNESRRLPVISMVRGRGLIGRSEGKALRAAEFGLEG
jgi:hypothetical protein